LEEDKALEVANFRYSVIAPVVSRKLERGELSRYLREASSRRYEIPNSKRDTVHRRTIEKWIFLYRKGGFDALFPRSRKDTGFPKVMPEGIVKKAVALKREVPERSVSRIIEILEGSGEVEPGVLKRTTLSKYMRLILPPRGLKRGKKEAERGYRRFEAKRRNELWQGDCQHGPYLPDPQNPERKRQTYLIAFIDDRSRLIPHAEYYFEESRPKLEDCLKKAMLKYGLPERLFLDNAAIFSSRHLERICGELAVHLVHSRVGKAASRGKIEAFFRNVKYSFKPEVCHLINSGEVVTLDDLNERLWAFIEVYYHRKPHGSTKEPPLTRWLEDPGPIREADPLRLKEVFLWTEQRKVNKAGCISLYGETYEVDSYLSNRVVTLKYDPYDPREVRVFYQGKECGAARPLDPTRERALPSALPKERPAPTGLSFLDLLVRERRKVLEETLGGISFREAKDDV
jgi:Mu transposase, C-terminal./Integrase core domain.